MTPKEIREEINGLDRFASGAGIRVGEILENTAAAELITGEAHANAVGYVQGGVLYTLADTAATAAAWSSGRRAVTLEGKINFLRPAKADGSKLSAVARAKHVGKTTGVYECDILDENGRPVAAALFTFYYLGD